nr:hypothetical protein 1 [Mute swan feces associated tombus-like virus 5]
MVIGKGVTAALGVVVVTRDTAGCVGAPKVIGGITLGAGMGSQGTTMPTLLTPAAISTPAQAGRRLPGSNPPPMPAPRLLPPVSFGAPGQPAVSLTTTTTPSAAITPLPIIQAPTFNRPSRAAAQALRPVPAARRIVGGVLHPAGSSGGPQDGSRAGVGPPGPDGSGGRVAPAPVGHPSDGDGAPPGPPPPPPPPAARGDALPLPHNFQPDDQDRPLRYYAPLRDVFMRQALPTLRGPVACIVSGLIARHTPHKRIAGWALHYSIRHARPSFGNFCRQSLGELMLGMARSFKTFALATDRILLRLFWDKCARTCAGWGDNAIHGAAIRSCPKVMMWAYRAAGWMRAAATLSTPVLIMGAAWGLYVVVRHAIEPPPYDAPPGTYPSGGPLIEISQEDAPHRAMVFTCPATLARMVQERVLLCERDPVMIQKCKAIASKYCDTEGIFGNERYATVAGAVAAALTVPVNEQLILNLAQSHQVTLQQRRIQQYLGGITHRHDNWWTKYLSIRR